MYLAYTSGRACDHRICCISPRLPGVMANFLDTVSFNGKSSLAYHARATLPSLLDNLGAHPKPGLSFVCSLYELFFYCRSRFRGSRTYACMIYCPPLSDYACYVVAQTYQLFAPESRIDQDTALGVGGCNTTIITLPPLPCTHTHLQWQT